MVSIGCSGNSRPSATIICALLPLIGVSTTTACNRATCQGIRSITCLNSLIANNGITTQDWINRKGMRC